MVTICALCLLSIHFVYGAPSLVCVKHCLLQLFFSPSRYLLSLSIPSATMLFPNTFSAWRHRTPSVIPFLVTTNFQHFHLPFHPSCQSPTGQPQPPTCISPSGLIPMQNLTGNNHLRLQSEVCRPNNKQRKAPALATRPVNIGEDIRKMMQRIRTWSHCMDCGGICCCTEELGEPGIGERP
jgi:hypothetical protein